MILITLESGNPRGRFVAYEDGKEVGEMTFEVNTEKRSMVFDHTFVEPSMRGKNVAGQLYDQAKAFCQSFDFEMIPVCSYVVSRMQRERQ